MQRQRPDEIREGSGFPDGRFDLDHFVDVIDGDDLAFEDVGVFFGFGQQVARAADDDVLAVVAVLFQHLLEIEDAGTAADQGQHVDGEGGFQRRVLVELVEDHVAVFAALEFDDDAEAFLAAFVVDVADALDAIALD